MEAKKKKSHRVLISRRTEVTDRKLGDFLVLGIAGLIIIFGITFFHLGIRGMNLADEAQVDLRKGFEKIESGVAALAAEQFELAAAHFFDANDVFQNIRNEAWFVDVRLPLQTINDPLFDVANNVTIAGQSISRAGISLSEIARQMHDVPSTILLPKAKRPGVSLTEELKKTLPLLENATQEVSSAASRLEDIPLVLMPQHLRDRFSAAKSHALSLAEQLNEFQSTVPALLTLLGDTSPHTFLVLLQNNAELRPTGGFIGSFILAETNEGYITGAIPHDVYHFDHQLTEVITPPEEILSVNNRWYMRDANYSRNFPTSAQKVAWFLEKEGGPSVDTVIAIDVSFVEELLRLTGPVRIPELSQPLNADNFSSVMTYVTEAKLAGRQDPKAILKSFIETVTQKLSTRIDASQMIALIMKLKLQGSVQGFSHNEDVQKLFARLDIAGEIGAVDSGREDFLAIAHTNMGGNKTDRYMKEEITHTSWINADGTVTNDLEITRTHTWDARVEERILKLLASFGFKKVEPKVLAVLGKATNVHMLRIYVPKDSVLISSNEKDVVAKYDPDLDLTYFSATMHTEAQLTRKVNIRYKIPLTLDLSPVGEYRIRVLAQPGQPRTTFVKRMLPDKGVINYSYSPPDGVFEGSGVWNYTTELAREVKVKSGWGK